MLQPSPVQASPFAEWVRNVGGRRAIGLVLTLLIELVLLLVLLTLATERPRGEEERRTTVVSIRAEEAPQETPEQERPQPQQQQPETQPRPRPEQPQPDRPSPTPPAETPPAPTPPAPSPIMPMRWELAPPNPMRQAERPAPQAPPARVYGPVDTRPAALRDSVPIGRAPNGEPLYAAEWYREPRDDMMRGYLSGARGPGWGLIACRTAPDFRVEDCVGIGEYPEGSMMMRSVLAMAWEFRVRPPRRGGQPLIGSWVRIRIDYGTGRRQAP